MGLSIIISCFAASGLSIWIFRRSFLSYIREDLLQLGNGMWNIVDDWHGSLSSAADSFSTRSDLIDSLYESDFDNVDYLVAEEKSAQNYDFLMVTDEKGAIVSGGSIPFGTSMTEVSVVQTALKGKEGFAFEKPSGMPFAMLSAAPIYSGGRVIGVVITGYDLSSPDFVDFVNGCIGVECTVFEKNVRVSTTIHDDSGKSIVGTLLDNQMIVKQVLDNGEDFHGNNIIRGIKYASYYTPVRNSSGTITGMLFIAKNESVINGTISTIFGVVSSFVLVLCVLLMILASVLIAAIIKPLTVVKRSLADISSGDADLTKRIPLSAKDEIGDVVIGFNTFSGKLQDIITELKTSKDFLDRSGEDMGATTEDTANAISQIISNIDSVHAQIADQTGSVSQTAGAVNEIAANISSLNTMIEKQAAGVTEASAAVEQMIGNIASVNNSVDKMAGSFKELQDSAQNGFTKQQAVNERIQQIESQSEMLQTANQAIASIASQTNLLAMNAAIEAAHAGEAGKGFSVVADEIRKLSETSSAQSKTIGDQLKKIKASIGEVVKASEESSAVFSAVSEKIQETDELVIHIKSAMEEQNTGSRQIGDALKHMNDSSNEVRSASEEMAEGNKLILSEIKQLQEATSSMNSSVGEMSDGARKIKETGSALADIAAQVKESIIKIGTQVDKFKV